MNKNNYIKSINNIKEIDNLLKKAIKDGIIFSDKCIFNGMFYNELLIGFCGLLIKNNKAILKCDYILPEYRKRGYLMEMIDFRKIYIKTHYPVISIIEANCTKLALNSHLKCGAKIIKVYKNGITQIRYENI